MCIYIYIPHGSPDCFHHNKFVAGEVHQKMHVLHICRKNEHQKSIDPHRSTPRDLFSREVLHLTTSSVAITLLLGVEN